MFAPSVPRAPPEVQVLNPCTQAHVNSPFKVSLLLKKEYSRRCNRPTLIMFTTACPVFCHSQGQPHLINKKETPQETIGGGHVPEFWSCGRLRQPLAGTVATGRRDEITCWRPTTCPTSCRSRTCRTRASGRVAEASPASSCPDLTAASPGTRCWRLPAWAWLRLLRPPTC